MPEPLTSGEARTLKAALNDLEQNVWEPSNGGPIAQQAFWEKDRSPAWVNAFRQALAPAVTEDVVNHPSHYKQNGLEAIDVLEAFDLKRDGRLFNAGKYILRAGKKDDELQDLKKAVWYLNRYIIEQENSNA